MRRALLAVCCLCLGSCASQVVPQRRDVAAGRQAEQLLFNGQYQVIDGMEKQLQTSKGTNDKDQPGLLLFYKAIVGADIDTEAAWQSRRKLLEKWQKDDPGSFVPTLALAHHYFFYGWWLRSTQVASKLTSQQVQGFRKNLDESLRLAASIEKSANNDPAWYELMLWLGVAQGWPQAAFNRMYEHAIAVRPDYLMFPLSKAQYVSARWYGSKQEFAAFANAASKKYARYFGDRLYGRIQWGFRLDDMFDSGQADWAKTKQSFAAIAKVYPTRTSYKEFAELACIAEDWEVAANNFAAMNPPLAENERNSRYLQRCKLKADGYSAATGNRTAAEVKAAVGTANDHTTIIAPRWTKPPEGDGANSVPKGEMNGHDMAEIASVAGDQVHYMKRRDTVLDVARRDPAVVSMMNHYNIELLEKDFAQVIYLVATKDPARAEREMRRIPHEAFGTRDRIRRYYRSRLGPGFESWVWQYPGLWGNEEVKLFAEVRPRETLARLGRTGNPGWYLDYVEDMLLNTAPDTLFEYLATLPTEQREKAFKSATAKLERKDLDKALEIVSRSDDDLGQRTAGVLLDAIKQNRDPVAMMDKHHIHVPERSLAKIIEQFAEKHPRKAGHYLSRIHGKTKQDVILSVSAYYRFKFKEDYADWLKANPEWISEFNRHHSEGLAKGSARRDQATVLESIALPESRLQQDRVDLFAKVVQQNPEGARHWLDKTRRKVPETAVAIVAEQLMRQGRPGVYEWLSRFPESKRLIEVRIQAFGWLAHSDPSRASTMVAAMPARRRLPAIHAVLQEWLSRDTNAAMAWARKLAPGAGRDEAMVDAGDYMVQADMDYRTALEFYGKIDNPDSRRLAVMNIMPLIYLKDSSEFAALTTRYGFDQGQLQEFKKTASGIRLVNGHL